MNTECRLGYEEYDGSRYCFEHGGFAHYLMRGQLMCDRAGASPNTDRYTPFNDLGA